MDKEYIENSNKYYNLTTGAYRAYFGEHFHFFLWSRNETREQAIKKTNEMFLSDGKLTSESNVIDLGCGIGSLSILIAKKYKCRVTGININDHQLKISKERSRKEDINITFLKQDIMRLNLGGEFNTAFFIDVEPHLPDKRKAIRNIKNLLKKNGRIVMTAWLQSKKINLAQREFLTKPLCRVGAFPYMETFDGYRNIFKKEGLKIIRFEDFTAATKRVVDDFYVNLFEIIKNYNSWKVMSRAVKNIDFLSSLNVKEAKKAAEDIFLGPVYAKLCMDAGVFRFGYFVVENR